MSFRLFQILLVSFFGLLFVISAFLGVVHGKAASESKVVLDNAAAVDTAINNFFEDQDRYPSQEEFIDPSVFGAYLSAFPVAEIKADSCEADFDYKNPNPYSYELYVCLPRGITPPSSSPLKGEDFRRGWNVYNTKSVE